MLIPLLGITWWLLERPGLRPHLNEAGSEKITCLGSRKGGGLPWGYGVGGEGGEGGGGGEEGGDRGGRVRGGRS